MIWFACKSCGKRHKQSDDAAGSLVFCECGHSNRVPWESTVPAPRPPAESEPRPGPRRGRRRERRRRDPAVCFNHPDDPSAATCPDCGEAFCPRCLVEFQGTRLCAPCKNFRVRKLQRPAHVGGLAVGALAAGLVCAPLVFCGTMMAVGSRQPPTVFVGGLIGMVLGAAALLMGVAALRQAEGPAGRGGQGLAMTGAALGTAALVWSLSLVVIMAGRLFKG
ncbi:MAG TPA: hypothetical protein VFW33_04765 [Gemmataceae bacterium]|nr:hypothetical protein [Gemmataceae bacterium]